MLLAVVCTNISRLVPSKQSCTRFFRCLPMLFVLFLPKGSLALATNSVVHMLFLGNFLDSFSSILLLRFLRILFRQFQGGDGPKV